MAIDRNDAIMIAEEIGNVLDRRARSGPTAPGYTPSAAPDIKWMGGLTSAAVGVTDGFGKLSIGTYSLNDAFSTATTIVGKFGSLGSFISQIGGSIGNTFIAMNESLKKASDSGIYFGNNLGRYSELVTGARMSMQEFNEYVIRSGTSITSLGLGSEASANRFLVLARGLQEEPVTRALQATGVSIESFNQLLITNVTNRKFLDLSSDRAQQSVIASTVAMAKEIDNISRLYGISSDQQRKTLNTLVEQDHVALGMMAMTEAQQTQFLKTTVELGKYGDSVQKLFAEAATTGGVRTTEGAARMAGLGEMGPLIVELGRLTQSGREEDRARIPELQRQLADVQARQSTDLSKYKEASLLALAAPNDPYVRELVKTMREQMPAAAFEKHLQQVAAETGKPIEEVRKALQGVIEKERALEGGPEAQISTTLNQAGRLLKDIAAGTGAEFRELNKTTGETVANFNGLNNVLKGFNQSQAKEVAGAVKDALAPGSITKTFTLRGKLDVPQATPAKPVERQDGSLGAVGKYIEDFGKGTHAILHGKEGIITEKQFGNLFGNVRSGLQFEMEKVRASAPTTATFETMFNQMFSSFAQQAPQEQTKPITVSQDNTAITDVKEQLVHLNTLMSQLLAYTSDVAANTDQQVRATKQLSGNLLA